MTAGIATAVIGGAIVVTSAVSVRSAGAEAVGTPIVLPLPASGQYSAPFAAGGGWVGGVDMESYQSVLWDLSGAVPAVEALSLPSGVQGAEVAAIDDVRAVGGSFDGSYNAIAAVVWPLADTAHPITLGTPAGFKSATATAVDGDWVVGTGVAADDQPHGLAWHLPSTTAIDLGFVTGKSVLSMTAVSGTWAVGTVGEPGTCPTWFPSCGTPQPKNTRPVAWDLSAGSPAPIVLPALGTKAEGSTTGLATGKDGIALAIGNMATEFGGVQGVAWKLAASPAAPVELPVSTGFTTRADKGSGGWVLGGSISDAVAWDLSVWDGTGTIANGKILGSLEGASVTFVSGLGGDWAVGAAYVGTATRAVAWDLSQANPVAIELKLPTGHVEGSASLVTGGYAVGSSTATDYTTYQSVVWKLSELSGGGGPSSYTVTVTKPTNGSITGGDIDCGGSSDACTATVAAGGSVTLTATADTGYLFGSWGGSCSGALTTCTLSMTQNRTASASFGAARTLTVTGPTNGVINGANGAIQCGKDKTKCSVTVIDGTALTLGASFDDYYALDTWTGCNSTTNGVCSVTMNADKSVQLSVSTFGRIWVVPSTASPVTSTDSHINCTSGGSPVSCWHNYAPGSAVTLTTSTAVGFRFTAWVGGTCSEGQTSLTCTVTASALTTNIMRPLYEMLEKVTVLPQTFGTVSSSDGNLNCGGGGTVCEAWYSSGAEITLTAAPVPGYLFTGWAKTGLGSSCQLSGMSPKCTLNKWTTKTAQATFAKALNLTVVRPQGGTLSSPDGKIKCGTSGSLCSAILPQGFSFGLSATADPGNEIGGWLGSAFGPGGCQYVTSCSFVMDEDRVFPGMGFARPVTITVQMPNNGRVFRPTWDIYDEEEKKAPIDCGLGKSVCSKTVMLVYGRTGSLRLEAGAAPNWFFGGWTGCDAPSIACELTFSGNTSVTARFVQATKLTINPDVYTGGLVTSADGRIKCGPGFANCSNTYQGAPTVSLTFQRSDPQMRTIVVEWTNCYRKAIYTWSDTWTNADAGCTLLPLPGAGTVVTPRTLKLTDAVTEIFPYQQIPPAMLPSLRLAAQNIQAGVQCAANLKTFVDGLKAAYDRGGLTAPAAMTLVVGAKALCPPVIQPIKQR